MKKSVACLGLALMSLFSACRSGFEHNKSGMAVLDKEIKEEFGKDAWFTRIELSNKSGSDDAISLDMSKDPNSLQQEQWTQYHGIWNKEANVTLSVQGAEPKAFMFQLDKEASLPMLGELMEKSVAQLRTEKGIEDPQVIFGQIRSNHAMNDKHSGIMYHIAIESKKAAKSFYFIYDLDGHLVSLTE